MTSSPHPISTLLVLALASIAAVTDLSRHKIYNWTTYPGILSAFIVNALEPDGIGLSDSLTGFVACGGIMLVAFTLFGLGGGDVKLMAMLGAGLGLRSGIEVLLWTFVLGAVVGISVLIWRIGCWRLVRRAGRQLYFLLRFGSWIPLTLGERRQLQPRLHLAPPALVAVLIVTFSLVDVWN